MTIPALGLTYTTLRSTRIISEQSRGLYACEAAQELVMWKLYHGTLVDELPDNGDSVNFTVDVCGTLADVSVVMRAVELEGGVVLATEHTMMPAKTVVPNQVAAKGITPYFTYTITIEQVSINNTAPLLAIYDIMSAEFGKTGVYKAGSSEISTDGVNWTPIPEPNITTGAQQIRLRWPASGSFPSDFGYFQPGQEKYLRFKVNDKLQHDNVVACNRVVLQVGDVFTLSDPMAPIVVGTVADPDACSDVGMFAVTKSCWPPIIPPLEPTPVTYTITVTNMEGSTERIGWIDDFLPPGFEYTGPTTGSITQMEPYSVTETKNGVTREHLWWQWGGEITDQLTANGVSIAAGANMTLTFNALATQGISGTYYNEVLVQSLTADDIGLISSIDDSLVSQLGQTYSWNSGTVIVPAYDSHAESEGVEVDANMSLEPDRVRIISWSVR